MPNPIDPNKEDHMPIIELTADNVNDIIDNNDKVIVDFWASWCGPCKAFKPIFEDAAESHPDFVFASCNTEEQQQLAAAFGIRSIPTVMVFREQVLMYSQPGMLPAATLEKLLDQVNDLDMEKVHREVAAQQEEADRKAANA